MSMFIQNPDVIIIGAGASGLSAAQTLINAGLKTLVLESDDHIGGRCITDTSTFATPFDRGGSWLHSAEINPLSGLAEKHGFEFFKTPWVSQQVISNGKHLSDEEVVDYRKYMDEMWNHITEVGKTDLTTAIEPILPDSEWKDTAKLFISHILGGDYDVTTPSDLANYEHSDGNWLIEGGLGNFIKHLHCDVDVVLDCPVSKIDYSGSKVHVTTPKGTVEADHVVLTVSVGVLAAEKIEFIPTLPNQKLQAISDLPNGLLNKVGFEFDPSWSETHEGYLVDYHPCEEEYCNLAFKFYDSNLMTAFTGGRFAAQVENEGIGAATDFCMQALKEVFGNDVTKYVTKTSETAWNNYEHTFGSYSYPLPGRTSAREVLAETINEKVFFAGEATMKNTFATVHGAYLSGKRAAKKIIDIQQQKT